MKLIIVESPTKAKTLTRFLDDVYRIEASVGHVRDLPKSELGVDIEHDFAPKYIIPRNKKTRVKELKNLAKQADEVILATDPDREGEAIAWHIGTLLTVDSQQSTANNDDLVNHRYKRIVFHEITKSAILEALQYPRSIDMRLVDAQQARRILDRLVGYTLSPLLWKKLSRRWLSAGRVQSVATRLIVERERARARFVKESYWTISAEFSTSDGHRFIADLVAYNGVPYEQSVTIPLFDGLYTVTKTTIPDEASAKRIIDDIQAPFTLLSVDTKDVRRSPPPPYTTSSLQQDAGRRLGLSSKKIMQLAQRLYEEGYITYHRTDSVNLSNQFLRDARSYIQKTHGDQFISPEPRRYATKSKVAQEAHEAIRPTNISLRSKDLEGKEGIQQDHIRLYDLIWKRAVATQASDALFRSTTIRMQSMNTYVFQAKGSIIQFEGYLKILGRDVADVLLPQLSQGDSVQLVAATPTEHATNPPPRYTEASLVKALEEKDIGRPSTYASIISTILERQYVQKEEKALVPTDLGNAVTDFLVQYFPDIMSLPFTAIMEELLDQIARGERPWPPVVREFYLPFSKDLDHAQTVAEKVKLSEEKIGEQCPECGGDLVVKLGRYGKFIACSNFPSCSYRRQYRETIDRVCPKCGGAIVVKRTKTKRMFFGCVNYPSCDFAAWKKDQIP